TRRGSLPVKLPNAGGLGRQLETAPRSGQGHGGPVQNERVVISRYGPAEALETVCEPAPLPRFGEVRIRVEAAGVSFGDVVQRSNLFFAGAPKLPSTRGYDIVGAVDAIGEGVTGVAVGDRVAALTIFFGYARYICVPATWAVKVPPGLDAAQV